jgi:anti-anti-sigma factor
MLIEREIMSTVFEISMEDSITVLRPLTNSFLKLQADEFKRIVETLTQKKHTRIVLDLTGCEYISSDGLGAVAHCWRWCHAEGHGNMAVALSHAKENEVINLFDITGLTTTIGSALQANAHDAINYLLEFT